jgi:hypothetical protein
MILALDFLSKVTVKIDIDQPTESELIDLNHRIVARLRMFAQLRAHTSMLGFKVGERVSFDSEGGRRIVGMLLRYNKRTVSLVTDDGHRWNVSPALLTRAATSSVNPQSQNVVALCKE